MSILGPCSLCGRELSDDPTGQPASRTSGFYHRRCWNSLQLEYPGNTDYLLMTGKAAPRYPYRLAVVPWKPGDGEKT